MKLPTWIRQTFFGRRRPISGNNRWARLLIEVLEGRLTPSGPPGGGGSHAPLAVDNTVQTPEDTAYTFQAANFNFSDPNDTPPDVFNALKILSLPAAGALKLDGQDVAQNQLISISAIEAGLFKFVPATNENGAAYTCWDFAVQDSGNAYGGANTSAAHTMTHDVTAVNDAPSFGASDPPATDENVAVTILNWATFDPGAVNEVGQQATYVVASVGNSSLFSVLPTIDANGTLTYSLASHASGTSTFTVYVSDDGGVANGGVDTSPVAFFNINVNAVTNPFIWAGPENGSWNAAQNWTVGGNPAANPPAAGDAIIFNNSNSNNSVNDINAGAIGFASISTEGYSGSITLQRELNVINLTQASGTITAGILNINGTYRWSAGRVASVVMGINVGASLDFQITGAAFCDARLDFSTITNSGGTINAYDGTVTLTQSTISNINNAVFNIQPWDDALGEHKFTGGQGSSISFSGTSTFNMLGGDARATFEFPFSAASGATLFIAAGSRLAFCPDNAEANLNDQNPAATLNGVNFTMGDNASIQFIGGASTLNATTFSMAATASIEVGLGIFPTAFTLQGQRAL